MPSNALAFSASAPRVGVKADMILGTSTLAAPQLETPMVSPASQILSRVTGVRLSTPPVL